MNWVKAQRNREGSPEVVGFLVNEEEVLEATTYDIPEYWVVFENGDTIGTNISPILCDEDGYIIY
jgi:hypothetical protein